MDAPVQLLYSIKTRFIEITGRLPLSCAHPVRYAKASQTRLNNVDILVQAYGNYFHYTELYEFKCENRFQINFQVLKPAFFLFFMLNGKVRFTGPDGLEIAAPEKHCCYATFNSPGVYHADFSSGLNEILYFAIHPDWLESLSKELPGLQPLIYQFLYETGYGTLPQYHFTGRMILNLKRLQQLQAPSQTELNGALQLIWARILVSYNELLTKNRSEKNELAYRALNFIGINFRSSELSIPKIVNELYTTKTTLTNAFRKEFNITPSAYLIHLRMNLARDLLRSGQDISLVCGLVGYKDVHSFRVRYKATFGHPPRLTLKLYKLKGQKKL
jgi:AraC-like DNA-binding protein